MSRKVEARIARDYEARRNIHEMPFTRDELLRASEGADAPLITPLEHLDSEFFQRAPASIRVIATYSVGLDHIDLLAAVISGVVAHGLLLFCQTHPSSLL